MSSEFSKIVCGILITLVNYITYFHHTMLLFTCSSFALGQVFFIAHNCSQWCAAIPRNVEFEGLYGSNLCTYTVVWSAIGNTWTASGHTRSADEIAWAANKNVWAASEQARAAHGYAWAASEQARAAHGYAWAASKQTRAAHAYAWAASEQARAALGYAWAASMGT